MSCMLLLACATTSCCPAVTGALTWSVPAFGLSHCHKHVFMGVTSLAASALHCMVSTEHCIELRWLCSCREQCGPSWLHAVACWLPSASIRRPRCILHHVLPTEQQAADSFCSCRPCCPLQRLQPPLEAPVQLEGMAQQSPEAAGDTPTIPELDARSASPDIFRWSIPGLLADIKVRRCRPMLWAFAMQACSGGTLGLQKACGCVLCCAKTASGAAGCPISARHLNLECTRDAGTHAGEDLQKPWRPGRSFCQSRACWVLA